MRSIVLFLIIGIYSHSSLATIGPDNIVTVTQTSTTGKTLILNKGSSGYLVENSLGVLLVVVKEKNKTLYKPVAKVKSVKVFGESSIWVAYKTFISKELIKGNKLILLDEHRLLEGREGLTFKRTKIISKKENLANDLKENLLEGTDNLSLKEKDYRVERILHSKEKHYDKDIELVDLDIWEDKKGTKRKQSRSIYKSKYSEEFSQKHRIQTFEKMVVAFIRKYNDPKFTIARKYFNERSENNLISEIDSKSVYKDFVDNEEKRLAKEDQIYNDLNLKGEAWSDDYSDEELSELVYNVGVIKERERRIVVSAYHFKYQVYGHFGLNLINNENLDDRANTAQSKYDLELALEYYAFKDFDTLRKISFEFSARRSVDAYSIGNGFNATSTEFSFAGGLNYYPFQSPNTLQSNIVYAGVYLRSGVSVLQINDTNEIGSYSVLTFPGIRLGFKYNFTNAYGIRVFSSFENISASRIEKSDSAGFLPDVASYTEGKLSIGLSRLF